VYYAVDPGDLRQTETALEAWFDSSPADVSWFSLLDLAFVTESPAALRSFSAFSPVSLFIEPPLDRLVDASPVLIALDREPQARMTQVSKLLRLTQGVPMLGFVSTVRSADEQVEAWQPYVYPRCVDEQRFVLRFADARIAANLEAALSKEHWRGMTAGLGRWLIVGREGTLVPLLTEAVSPLPSETCEPVCLSAEELGQLMQFAEPDAVIGFLNEHFPELLPQAHRARLHTRIGEACTVARDAGIRDFQDMASLSHAVVLTEGAVLADPRLVPLLAEPRTPGQLAGALLDLLPDS
jgi:hypothetical protein